jgi:ZIP family zinc transporter
METFAPILAALGWAWAGSCLGSCAAWLPMRPRPGLQAGALGLAAGVMVAAALLGLIPDAVHQAHGRQAVVWLGFAAGLAGIALLDRFIPHQHPGDPQPDHARSIRGSAARLIALALILHKIPEGMAVGVAAAAGAASPSGPVVIAAIAIHNVLEGMLIAVPLQLAGTSRLTAFALGQLAGIIALVSGLAAALLLPADAALIPAAMAAAAGAMVFIAFEELLPEALRLDAGNSGPIGAVLGVGGLIVLTGLMGG